MYNDFYRLRENPFNVTSDPDFFFSSRSHSEGLTMLCYGIEQRKGIMVVTGEVGTGKTTLLRKILRLSDAKTKFAFILNPSISATTNLLKPIVEDFGLKPSSNNKYDLMKLLNEFLLQESNKGNNVVLIVDEAQNLTAEQLEEIRLLSNIETEKEKLLQIILAGQPELNEKLSMNALRQLRQRVTIHFDLSPLPKEDIRDYIEDRIGKASGQLIKAKIIDFTDRAIEAIFTFTKGSPRTINILCDRALLAGFIRETFSIDESIIKSCAKEVLYCEHNI